MRPLIRDRAAVRHALAALGGLGLLAAGGGCATSPPSAAFDLTAPRQPVGGGIAGQLVVAEPSAIQPLEETRILAKDAAGSVSYLPGAQWADRLPRLFQARLIQTFENASKIRAVSRPGDGVTADFQLNTELRAFQLDAARNEAYVEVSAKIVSIATGKIVSARLFSARVPVPNASGPAVAQFLDVAQANVLLDIVRWVSLRQLAVAAPAPPDDMK